MNKKIVLCTVLIAIIALALAAWFGNNLISELQNQINDLREQNEELQDQKGDLQKKLFELEKIFNITRDVKITNFEWIGGYHHLGQVNLFQNFKVTIQNMGTNTVSGLTLSVRLLSTSRSREIDEHAWQINITHAGQIVETHGDVSVGEISSYVHSAVGVATLTMDDIVLDQQTRNLQSSFLY